MQGYKLGTTGVIEAAGTPSCPQCSCDASGAAVAAAPGEAAEVAPAAVVPAAGGGTSAPALAGWRSSPLVGDASYTSQVPRRQLDKGVVSYGSRARARQPSYLLVCQRKGSTAQRPIGSDSASMSLLAGVLGLTQTHPTQQTPSPGSTKPSPTPPTASKMAPSPPCPAGGGWPGLAAAQCRPWRPWGPDCTMWGRSLIAMSPLPCSLAATLHCVLTGTYKRMWTLCL